MNGCKFVNFLSYLFSVNYCFLIVMLIKSLIRHNKRRNEAIPGTPISAIKAKNISVSVFE